MITMTLVSRCPPRRDEAQSTRWSVDSFWCVVVRQWPAGPHAACRRRSATAGGPQAACPRRSAAVGAPAPLLEAARCCSWLMMTCTMDRPSYVKLIANHHNQHAHRQSAFAACCLRRFCCRTESVGVDFALDSAFVMRLI